jgi:hypothetical protein
MQRPFNGMVLTNPAVTALPVAPWITRYLLMRRVRQSMTNSQYIAFCRPTGYPGLPLRGTGRFTGRPS